MRTQPAKPFRPFRVKKLGKQVYSIQVRVIDSETGKPLGWETIHYSTASTAFGARDVEQILSQQLNEVFDRYYRGEWP